MSSSAKNVLRILKIYCLIILLLASANVAWAQGIKATAKLEPQTILIGDQVNLRLGFSFPAGAQVV